MSKLFTIIFLVLFEPMVGQKLKFDVMAVYSISQTDSNFEKSAYGISNNPQFIMQIINRSENQIATVYDLIGLKKHDFEIIEKKAQNLGPQYNFKFKSTSTFKRFAVKPNYYEFKKISELDEVETVKLNIYKTRSRKNMVNTFSLQIAKSEIDLFPLFRFICLHPSEFDQDLTYSQGGLVLSVEDVKGLQKFKLKTLEEVNLEFILPK